MQRSPHLSILLPLALVAGGCAGIAATTPPAVAQAQPTASHAASAAHQGTGGKPIRANGDSKMPTSAQLHPALAALAREYAAFQAQHQGKRGSAPGFHSGNPLLQVVDGKVLVEIVASGSTEALRRDLKALGAQVTGSFKRNVSAYVPIGALNRAAHLKSLAYMAPSFPAHGNTAAGPNSAAASSGPHPSAAAPPSNQEALARRAMQGRHGNTQSGNTQK